MADATRQPVDVNQLHREVFGFSDDIEIAHGGLLPPRPPTSSSPAYARSTTRPCTQRAAARRPAPTTGGLASAKRLVFSSSAAAQESRGHGTGTCRDGLRPAGGVRSGPPAVRGPLRTGRARYTRRGSTSTKGPSTPSSSASFVSSSDASTAGADLPTHHDGHSESDSTDAAEQFASTNRYYVAVAPLEQSGTDSDDVPPAVERTGDRRGPLANPTPVDVSASSPVPRPPSAPASHRVSVDGVQGYTVASGTPSSPPHKPPPTQTSAGPPVRYAPSPWKNCGANSVSPVQGSAMSRGTGRFAHTERSSGGYTGRLTATNTHRTLLHWAEAGDVHTQPPPLYAELSAQAAEDVRVCAGPWRRLCAKGRHTMRVYGEHVAGLRDRRRRSATSARTSVLGLSADGATANKKFVDPNHSQLGHKSQSHSPKSLRAFRQQQWYGRWCRWKLLHFFESGPSYLGNVWRHRECGTLAQIPSLIDGRYVVPTDHAITQTIRALARHEQRDRLFRQLLLREHGVVGEEAEPSQLETTEDFILPAEKSPSPHGAQGLGDEKADEDVYKDDTVKTSYADLRFDTDTGLLSVSVYVDAPDSDETGTFLHSFVAGCLDGFRWLVLTGPWKLQVLFFQPLYDTTPLASSGTSQTVIRDKSHLSNPSAVETSSASPLFPAYLPRACQRRVKSFHSFCLHGIVFCREELALGARGGDSDSRPQDPFVCTRCGNLRVHNPLYVNHAGALARGRYRCWMCRRHTTHLRAPPSYMRERRLLEEHRIHTEARAQQTDPSTIKATARRASVSRSEREHHHCPQPPTKPRTTVSANLRFLSARTQSPQGVDTGSRRQARWRSSTHVNHDLLLGRTRPLSAAPPTPIL